MDILKIKVSVLILMRQRTLIWQLRTCSHAANTADLGKLNEYKITIK